MRLSIRAILTAVLAVCAVAAVALPVTAGSSVVQGPSAERTASPEEDQNPCQTQLVSDLKECHEEFGGVLTPDVLLEACVAGARDAKTACLEKQSVSR